MPADTLVQGRLLENLRLAVHDIFSIEGIRFDAPFPPHQHAIRLSGRFLLDTETAYNRIAARAQAEGLMIFFREEAGETLIYAVPGEWPVSKPNWRLFGILLAATLASVFVVGGVTPQGIDWPAGLSFAAPLILILLFHEFGHFLVSRHNKMSTSPPYFLPFPLSIFGTLGAVIVMRSPPKNRKHLFEMAVAGPLGGLLLAIPFLFIGLKLSTVGPPPANTSYIQEGNSLFYLLAKWLVFHQKLPGHGVDVQLHNMAYAAWVGLFITGLNLIPVGQFDGGHVAYTLFGKKAPMLRYLVLAMFLLLSYWYRGWLLWLAMIFFLGRGFAVPRDDLTPLPSRYRTLGFVMLALFVILFVPLPIIFVP
jgi:membrane-associated protease RseP (regulator of RpoE activity)